MTIIRKATEADAATITALAEATWWGVYEPIVGKVQVRYMLDTFYNTDRVRKQIINNDQTYILMLEDGKPVGFASYSARAENPDVYKLHKLYLLEGTRGKGYGKLLLEKVEDIVKELGKDSLELNVNRYNAALEFYRKLGYEVIYEEDIPVGPYFMNDYVMRKMFYKN